MPQRAAGWGSSPAPRGGCSARRRSLLAVVGRADAWWPRSRMAPARPQPVRVRLLEAAQPAQPQTRRRRPLRAGGADLPPGPRARRRRAAAVVGRRAAPFREALPRARTRSAGLTIATTRAPRPGSRGATRRRMRAPGGGGRADRRAALVGRHRRRLRSPRIRTRSWRSSPICASRSPIPPSSCSSPDDRKQIEACHAARRSARASRYSDLPDALIAPLSRGRRDDRARGSASTPSGSGPTGTATT